MEPSITGVAASQSQPSLGCCPSVCTRAQSECRPTSVPPPHSAMSLSKTSPRILCLWQKWHRLDQALIFHCSPVVCGLSWSICLSRFARGRVPPCVRPSVDVSNFLCVRTRTRAMMFSPWWKKERVADSDISMKGATRYCCVNVMITLATKHTWSDPCQYTKGLQFKLLLTVRRRAGYQLTVTGDVLWKDWKYWLSYVVWTGTQTAKQVTLFRCPNVSASEMLGRLTSDAVFGSNQVRAVCDPVIPHVRQRGTRSREGEREKS